MKSIEKATFALNLLEVNINAIEPYIKVGLTPLLSSGLSLITYVHFIFINSSNENDQILVERILKDETNVQVKVELIKTINKLEYVSLYADKG